MFEVAKFLATVLGTDFENVFKNLKRMWDSLFGDETKFDKDKVIGSFEPIYITLIAPRGAGKTSLLSTILKFMGDKVSGSAGIEVKSCKEDDEKRMNEFHAQLDTFIKAGEFNFTSAGDPSAAINKFEFEIEFTRIPNAVIKQKFIIMDIPGGIINNQEKNVEFEEHLEKSRILWIPVEAVALMPVLEGAKDEEEGRKNVLCASLMSGRLEKWAQKRLKFKGVPCSANFVLMKSESFFSHKKDNSQPAKVEIAFNKTYGQTISKVHRINPDVDISYVPVETIGVIHAYDRQWIEKDDKMVLNCVYQFDANATGVEISGVDRLMYNVLDYCHTSLSKKLDDTKAEIDKVVKQLDDMNFFMKLKFKRQIEEAKKLQKEIYDLANGLEPLQKKLMELKEPSSFSKDYSKKM